jgi:hypothetical protein
MESRNQAVGFAQRTRKNLQHIERAKACGADVHQVTQLGLSLLGLVVVPFAQNLPPKITDLPYSDLVESGWPEWQVTQGSVSTLGDVVYHVRNAAAHGHVRFSSDSPRLEEVSITIEDFKPDASSPYWKAELQAAQLREFCLKLLDLLEDQLSSGAV